MKFAVTYEDGEVFQHFGKTQQFMIYDSDGSKELLGNDGRSHGDLANLLQEKGVEALICGGLGAGAKNMLEARGITVYPGITGSADEAAKALIAGTLVKNEKSSCDHDHNCTCHD